MILLHVGARASAEHLPYAARSSIGRGDRSAVVVKVARAAATRSQAHREERARAQRRCGSLPEGNDPDLPSISEPPGLNHDFRRATPAERVENPFFPVKSK
jgi:hypothetical protein